ncbi:MAG: CBS domain-containing protein [Dehalococcoidia bacterium]|nr:CBS domain-containing protein [Dehalococcoidia bacterium]
MKVKEVMTRQAIKVSPITPIREVAEKMRDFGVEAVSVCDGDRFLGFVWSHDIVCCVVAGGSRAGRTHTRTVFRRLEISISPDADLIQAAAIMAENGVRLLPVLDHGRLVGLLSLEDVAEASEVFAGAILAAKAKSRGLAQPA